jgi:2-polyprenyl-6-hydroxyphenyl methylase/3-demethylubiquinone-9 3-methyltransferase
MSSENLNNAAGGLDTSTDERFLQYYQEQSLSEATLGRFERLVDLILKSMAGRDRDGPFDVIDVGGGAGTLARMFARVGHRATCVDLSADLLAVGEQRAKEEGLNVRFLNCSATDVPLPEAGFDVCVVPELLEHVADWESVLDEAARLTRPGGVLFLSTTNALCPKQDEFNLPLYSWYPGFLKRRYERLAVTTRPEVANYAKYPAVHWFTFYSLRDALRRRGFNAFHDRVDMIETRIAGTSRAEVAKWLRRIPLARLGVQFVTPNSIILAFKGP